MAQQGTRNRHCHIQEMWPMQGVRKLKGARKGGTL